jgi:hypothetical protein
VQPVEAVAFGGEEAVEAPALRLELRPGPVPFLLDGLVVLLDLPGHPGVEAVQILGMRGQLLRDRQVGLGDERARCHPDRDRAGNGDGARRLRVNDQVLPAQVEHPPEPSLDPHPPGVEPRLQPLRDSQVAVDGQQVGDNDRRADDLEDAAEVFDRLRVHGRQDTGRLRYPSASRPRRLISASAALVTRPPTQPFPQSPRSPFKTAGGGTPARSPTRCND